MKVGNERADGQPEAGNLPATPPAAPAEVAELHRFGLVPEPPGPDHEVRHDNVLDPDHHFLPGPQHSHPIKRVIL